jgi:sodium-dependent dicarboxylate transporter 2/3/5
MNWLSNKQVLATSLLVLMILMVQTLGIPGTDLTVSQSITAAILIIAAILWVTEWVSLFVVSFLILALELVWLMPALEADGITVVTASFFSPFFSNLILLFLGGFVLSSLMQKYGLDIRFAQWILRQTKGNPSQTLLGIILACSFLSMWISNTATTAMMLTMVFPLVRRIADNQPFRKALVLAIPFACNLGGIGTPIGTPPNAIALTYLAQKGITLSFTQWILLTMPFLIIFLLMLWQGLLRLYPVGDLKLDIPERVVGDFTGKHWFALAVFIATAIGWLVGGNFGYATGTIALFPIIIVFWFGLLDTNDFRGLPWDVLYMVSGGLALGVALNVTGLGSVLVNLLPLGASPWTLMAVAGLVAVVMSTVMSNTATAGLFIPLVMNLDFEQDYMLALVLTLALMCSMAMALPVSTPPNAIAFSSRAINTKDMVITGGLISIVGFAIVMAIGPLYWAWMLTWI